MRFAILDSGMGGGTGGGGRLSKDWVFKSPSPIGVTSPGEFRLWVATRDTGAGEEPDRLMYQVKVHPYQGPGRIGEGDATSWMGEEGLLANNDLKWAGVGPEIAMDFSVDPGHLTSFRLLRIDTDGNEIPLSMDWHAIAPDALSMQGGIKAGTITTMVNPNEFRRDIGIVIHSAGAKGTLSYFATLKGNWILESNIPPRDLYDLQVDLKQKSLKVALHRGPKPLVHDIDLAVRRNSAGFDVLETLTLRVETKPRPGTRTPALSEGWMGGGDPAAFIADWYRKQSGTAEKRP